jgi:hypothetical protein
MAINESEMLLDINLETEAFACNVFNKTNHWYQTLVPIVRLLEPSIQNFLVSLSQRSISYQNCVLNQYTVQRERPNQVVEFRPRCRNLRALCYSEPRLQSVGTLTTI